MTREAGFACVVNVQVGSAERPGMGGAGRPPPHRAILYKGTVATRVAYKALLNKIRLPHTCTQLGELLEPIRRFGRVGGGGVTGVQ